MSAPVLTRPHRGKTVLTADDLRMILDYDASTGVFMWKVAVAQKKAGEKAGSMARSGRIRICIGKLDYYAHKLAWLHAYGEYPLGIVDHINGIISDDRICNLRLATRMQNARNKKTQKNNKSGLKGVYWDRTCWRAKIYCNGKNIFLGSFKSAVDAYSAYCLASKKHHGEFGCDGVRP